MKKTTNTVIVNNSQFHNNSNSVYIGGNNPIVVQSMTNTDTENIKDTVKQIILLARAGAQIVRVTVNTIEAGNAIKHIKQQLIQQECYVPLVGDFHFNGHKILKNSDGCAEYLDKYRINPGNVGTKLTRDNSFGDIIKIAIQHDKPIRIGANWGSLDQDLLKQKIDHNNKLKYPNPIPELIQQTLIESALFSANLAIDLGLPANKIVISCKVSKVLDLIAVYKQLSSSCDFPLHLGLTEAGMGLKGIVSSSIAIGSLLYQGIGDTIRVSLTPRSTESRDQEVLAAQEILQALELKSFAPTVTACPGCGRTSSNYFIQLAEEIESYLAVKIKTWQTQYLGVENLKVAVMGCVVNGPGESKMADIGISLPGKRENPVAPIFIDGQKAMTLKGDNIANEFMAIIEKYVEDKYPKK